MGGNHAPCVDKAGHEDSQADHLHSELVGPASNAAPLHELDGGCQQCLAARPAEQEQRDEQVLQQGREEHLVGQHIRTESIE